MWRNVGKIEKRSYLRFADRHVFTINCARASRGLLIGGIIFLLTILALIPTYLLDVDAISVTHLTELVLLIVSLFTVCLSYFYTTKLYYDQHAHVDVFDQVLILITTVGEFAYSIFGLFASIFVDETKTKLPFGVEISIRVLAIFQTFIQSGFIMDALKRRTTTKQENRNKPGRETITALLLMNLGKSFHSFFIFIENSYIS
jgi:cation transport ATPase